MRSHLPARLVMVAAVSLLAASATDAAAHPGITGYSGKPYNGVSETCTTNCHAKGGAPPALTITVPATVPAGSTTAVTIVVAGNKTRTSMNAAFSDGVKTIKGSNTDTPLPVEEPTEIAGSVPPPNGATGTYTFSFIAPKTNGTVTMWVAGMAASGAGTAGDGVANATRTIMVTGGATVDAGSDAGGTVDAGGADGGGSITDAGGRESGTGEPGGSSGRASSSGEAPGDTGGGGCAVTAAGSASSHARALLGIIALGLLVLRRRSR